MAMARRFRIQITSPYDLEDWEPAHAGNSLLYRPSGRVLMLRLAVLIACGFVAASLLKPVPYLWRATASSSQALTPTPQEQQQAAQLQRDAEELAKKMLTPEQWQRVQAEIQQKRAAREAEQRKVDHSTRWIGGGLLALYCLIPGLFSWIAVQYGLLPVVRYPFDRLEIQRTPDNQLLIVEQGLFGKLRRSIPLDELGHLSWYVRKERTRYYRAWIWMVVIVPKFGGSLEQVTFGIERQKQQPDLSNAPAKVRGFLKDLTRLTNLPVQTPNLIDGGAPARRGQGWSQRLTTESVTKHEQEYQSLDEMPADVRQMFERLQSDPAAKEHGFVERMHITVTDSNGQERTYTSLEEVPPDLRQQIERHRKQQ